MSITINGLTYLKSNRMGECGATNNTKTLYFPFFLMGCCGDDECVISWNGIRERIIAPKKMDYNWFKLLAMKLESNPEYDWDWESFKKNILMPNKEHIKIALNINDDKIDVFMNDAFVFINNFSRKWEDDGEDTNEMESQGYYYPNFKNFIEKPIGMLEY